MNGNQSPFPLPDLQFRPRKECATQRERRRGLAQGLAVLEIARWPACIGGRGKAPINRGHFTRTAQDHPKRGWNPQYRGVEQLHDQGIHNQKGA